MVLSIRQSQRTERVTNELSSEVGRCTKYARMGSLDETSLQMHLACHDFHDSSYLGQDELI